MPSAPKYLQDMFEDDSAAFEAIDGIYENNRGHLTITKNPTEFQYQALSYLFMEWDYTFSIEENLQKRSY